MQTIMFGSATRRQKTRGPKSVHNFQVTFQYVAFLLVISIYTYSHNMDLLLFKIVFIHLMGELLLSVKCLYPLELNLRCGIPTQEMICDHSGLEFTHWSTVSTVR